MPTAVFTGTLLHPQNRNQWSALRANHRITEQCELEGPQMDQSSPVLNWRAHMGIEPMTLALIAPCSHQMTKSKSVVPLPLRVLSCILGGSLLGSFSHRFVLQPRSGRQAHWASPLLLSWTAGGAVQSQAAVWNAGIQPAFWDGSGTPAHGSTIQWFNDTTAWHLSAVPPVCLYLQGVSKLSSQSACSLSAHSNLKTPPPT